MPRVKVIETTVYDLDIAWLDPETDIERLDEEIEEIAREWAYNGHIEDESEGSEANPALRDPAVLSALLNIKEGGLDIEVINELRGKY